MAAPTHWSELSDAELLSLPLRNFRLELKGSPVEPELRALRRQLAAKRLSFRPHIWVSTEWFSPDGIPGFAVPFYLLHPRLVRLEHRQIGEAEGRDRRSRARLMRHETGHAIDTAYQLFKRRGYRRLFGEVSVRYRSKYFVSPKSREFVRNLPLWYAQSHPSEDFAETFAVWLDPDSRWRTVYQNWPALEKLLFVDELMRHVRSVAPSRTSSLAVEPLKRSPQTLRQHYAGKRRRYESPGNTLDAGLLREFGSTRSGSNVVPVVRSLAHSRQRILSFARGRSDYDRYSLAQGLWCLKVRAGDLGLKSSKVLGERTCRVLADQLIGFMKRLGERRDGLMR